MIFPNSPHGYGNYSPYMTRRRWDYFVRNLARSEGTPHEYVVEDGKLDPRDLASGRPVCCRPMLSDPPLADDVFRKVRGARTTDLFHDLL